MKKAFITILALALAGCSSSAGAAASASPSEEPVNTKTIWIHEPDLDFDSVTDLAPFNTLVVNAVTTAFGNVTLYLETEKTGYPGQWNNTSYSGDAMLVEKDSVQGIYSHDGTELYPVSVSKVTTPYIQGITAGLLKGSDGTSTSIAYGYASTSANTAKIFSSDYKTVTEVSLDQFDYSVESESANTANAYLAVQNGTLGIVAMKRTETGAQAGWAFEAYTLSGVTSNVIVPVVDDAMSQTGKVIISPDGTQIASLNTDMKYRTGSYVNDHYVVSDSTYATLVDASTGAGIAIQYQNAKYFEEGYAPVKKSGKWGYVDTSGNEVTDFIFDDAATLYNGIAWVKYNGSWGILNFQQALDDDETQVNAYWVDPTDEEQIGTVTVNTSNLTLRSGAGQDASQVGLCADGSVYPVFETKQNGDYTWYRINATMWIASEGSWATYTGA